MSGIWWQISHQNENDKTISRTFLPSKHGLVLYRWLTITDDSVNWDSDSFSCIWWLSLDPSKAAVKSSHVVIKHENSWWKYNYCCRRTRFWCRQWLFKYWYLMMKIAASTRPPLRCFPLMKLINSIMSISLHFMQIKPVMSVCHLWPTNKIDNTVVSSTVHFYRQNGSQIKTKTWDVCWRSWSNVWYVRIVILWRRHTAQRPNKKVNNQEKKIWEIPFHTHQLWKLSIIINSVAFKNPH